MIQDRMASVFGEAKEDKAGCLEELALAAQTFHPHGRTRAVLMLTAGRVWWWGLWKFSSN